MSGPLRRRCRAGQGQRWRRLLASGRLVPRLQWRFVSLHDAVQPEVVGPAEPRAEVPGVPLRDYGHNRAPPVRQQPRHPSVRHDERGGWVEGGPGGLGDGRRRGFDED